MKGVKIFRDIFRVRKFADSFRFAIKGAGYLFLYHRNMRIIFLVGILAFLTGLYLRLKDIELAVLCITIALVFVAEMFNTAIEMMIDMFTDKYHVIIMLVKDISAAVVLIASLNALAVGYVLLLKRFVR